MSAELRKSYVSSRPRRHIVVTHTVRRVASPACAGMLATALEVLDGAVEMGFSSTVSCKQWD